MRADILRESLPTSRALVSTVSPKRISGKFCNAKAEATGQALGDDVTGTVDEQEGALVHGQRSGSRTVHMRQTASGGVDDVAERDQLEAFRALHLHRDASLYGVERWSRPRHILTRREEPNTTGRDTRRVHPGAQWREATRIVAQSAPASAKDGL